MHASERGNGRFAAGFVLAVVAALVAANARSAQPSLLALVLGLLAAALMVSGAILGGLGSIADALRGPRSGGGDDRI